MLGEMVASHEALLALVALKPLVSCGGIHSTIQYRITVVHNTSVHNIECMICDKTLHT